MVSPFEMFEPLWKTLIESQPFYNPVPKIQAMCKLSLLKT
jgi:hypothetical protein